jgi:hypothetical protein
MPYMTLTEWKVALQAETAREAESIRARRVALMRDSRSEDYMHSLRQPRRDARGRFVARKRAS